MKHDDEYKLISDARRKQIKQHLEQSSAQSVLWRDANDLLDAYERLEDEVREYRALKAAGHV